MKFEFPALFLAEPRPIWPVPEINVPGTATDHHQKFRRDRTTHLGLVRPATDRQTDRLRRGSAPDQRLHSAPGVDVAPSNGGGPPKPPHSRVLPATPKHFMRIPATPKHFTRHAEWPFLIPQSPRCARGLIRVTQCYDH